MIELGHVFDTLRTLMFIVDDHAPDNVVDRLSGAVILFGYGENHLLSTATYGT